MAGPGLPVNVDATYNDDVGDPSVKTHQTHHDAIHVIANKFDIADPSAAGSVPVWTGTEYAGRTLTTTDVPLLSLNTRTTNYTLVAADAGKLVEMNVASANTLTVPPNSSVAFDVGTMVNVRQLGAGATTIVAGSGVTIRSRGALLALAGQYAEATLSKRATNEWVLSGDLA